MARWLLIEPGERRLTALKGHWAHLTGLRDGAGSEAPGGADVNSWFSTLP